MSDAAPAASNGRSSELIGRQIGNYLIEELLGVGGMGQVFRARHMMLDRLVAIKLMHPHFAQDPQFQARFRQEARSAAGLRHPHIVEVFDFDEQDGVPYLVMELITGGSFTTLLREGAAADPGWSLGRGLELLEQAAEALAYAHELGMIHRDIKPDNLLLQPGPAGALVLKVADFGLAKLGEGSGLTSANIALGTPAYMSPEQCQGRRLDGRSDVYALGVILFELATGVRPFAVRSLSEAIFKHVYMPVPSLRSIRDDIPDELEAIAVRCLAKVPEGRLSAAGLAVQLSMFAESAAGVRARAIHPPNLQSVQDEDTNAYQVGHIRTAPDVRTLSETRFDLPQVQVLDETGILLQVVAIPPGGLSIGRLPSNDLALEDQQVSRNHARVERQGQQVMIIDLGSRSGTQLGEAILPRSVFCEWPWRGLVRIGTYWLRLEPPLAEQRRQAQESDRPEIAAHAFGTAGHVVTALDPETLTLIPGQPAIVTLTLANAGPLAEQFHIEVEGVPEGWVQLPPTVQLAPGAQSRAQIVVEVPEESSVAAGEYPVTIRAMPHGHAEQASEVVARWLVAAQTRTLLRLTPTRLVAHGPGRFLARLTNVGNTTTSYQLSANGHAGDPMTLERVQATIGPGESVEVGLQVGASMALIGDERQSRIEVLAQSPESKSILRAEALYIRRAALSRLSAFAVLFAFLGIGVLAVGLWPRQQDQTPAALALFQATVSAQSSERETAAQTPGQGALQTPAAVGIVESGVVTPTALTSASPADPVRTPAIDSTAAPQGTPDGPVQSTPAALTPTQELPATQPLNTRPPATPTSVPPSETPRTSVPTTIVETSTSVVLPATSTPVGTREPAATPAGTAPPTRDPDGTALPASATTTGVVPTSAATLSPTPTPTTSPTATYTLTSTSIPTATNTATATPTPTATPTSTAISTATPTPTPTTRTLLGSLIFTPDPLDWGSVTIGAQHKRTVTVTNNGGVLVTITARSIPGPFSIVAGETTCSTLTVLNPLDTCQITIAVILTDTVKQTRQLTVTTLAGNQINYTLQVSAAGQ